MEKISGTFAPFDKFFLRTPLYSLDTIYDILKDDDYETIKLRLIGFFSKPLTREALYIASPSLFKSLNDYLADSASLNEKRQKNLVKSLYKYATRMATRSTPFGLFAGASVGDIADETNITIEPQNIDAFLQMDTVYAAKFIDNLLTNQEIVDAGKFYANLSVYPHFEKLRYLECKEINARREYTLTTVENSAYAAAVLKEASNGATIKELATLIIDEDVTKEDATAFILDMIDSKLLMHELNLSMLESNLSIGIRNFLGKLPGKLNLSVGEKIISVERLISLLNEIDSFYAIEDPLIRLKEYERIYIELGNHPLMVAESSSIFKTEYYQKSSKITLDKNYLNNLSTYISSTLQIDSTYIELAELKEKFLERYDQAEVPLLKFLDSEIGFNYPLKNKQKQDPGLQLEGADEMNANHAPNNGSVSWNNITKFLLSKYIQTIKESLTVAEITDEELKEIVRLNRRTSPLTSTFCCFATLFKEQDGGQNIAMNSIGPEAARLFARFGHLNDEVADLMQDITAAEKKRFSEDFVIAEINHTPCKIRSSNFVLRKNYYDYEISIINSSPTRAANQIPLTDLYVQVKNNEFVIRSRKLNKVVIPKNTTALNPLGEDLSIYRFLEDVGKQQTGAIYNIRWPDFLRSYKYLPRLVYKNITISAATWHFDKADVAELLTASNSQDSINTWREKWNIPRYILFCEHDNELYIDLENSFCVNIFLSLIKDRSFGLDIKESIERPSTSLVKDLNNNSYSGQMILPFKYTGDTKVSPKRTDNRQAVSKITRQFSPGSKWIYLKLYCNPITSNKILTECILPLCNKLFGKGVDQWFFVRFLDTDYHIRLRFHVKNPDDLGRINAQIHNALKKYLVKEEINKIQIETYVRELERYKPFAIDIAEGIFHLDSVTTIKALKYFYKRQDEDWSLMCFAIQSIDRLLEGFHFSREIKTMLLYKLSEGFGAEFNKKNDKNLKKQLAEKFKLQRGRIEQVLKGNWPDNDDEQVINGLLDTRQKLLVPLADALTKLLLNSKLSIDEYYEIILSYVHMLVNRLYIIDQRYHEMMIYDLLYNVYKSNREKEKKVNQIVLNEAVGSL